MAALRAAGSRNVGAVNEAARRRSNYQSFGGIIAGQSGPTPEGPCQLLGPRPQNHFSIANGNRANTGIVVVIS